MRALALVVWSPPLSWLWQDRLSSPRLYTGAVGPRQLRVRARHTPEPLLRGRNRWPDRDAGFLRLLPDGPRLDEDAGVKLRRYAKPKLADSWSCLFSPRRFSPVLSPIALRGIFPGS